MTCKSRVRWIVQDLDANRSAGGNSVATILSVRMLAVVLFRTSQLVGSKSALLGGFVKQFNHVVTGLDAAWNARAGAGLMLFHPTGVVIGPGVEIGESCRVQAGVVLGTRGGDKVPTIGDEVSLGSGAKILGGVTVGSRTVVGANAVVTRDIPSDSVAVGIPARARPRDARSLKG